MLSKKKRERQGILAPQKKKRLLQDSKAILATVAIYTYLVYL